MWQKCSIPQFSITCTKNAKIYVCLVKNKANTYPLILIHERLIDTKKVCSVTYMFDCKDRVQPKKKSVQCTIQCHPITQATLCTDI